MSFWILTFSLITLWMLLSKKRRMLFTGFKRVKTESVNEHSQQQRATNLSHHQTDVSAISPGEDELTTFTLINGRAVDHGGRDEHSPVVRNKSETTSARWIKPGESITIHKVVISRGNFYFGRQFKKEVKGERHYYGNNGSDASLVNDALSVKLVSELYQDESLGYWPCYSNLSPRGRGAYLNWLSGDRSEAATPIGYVFIYFYGIERRILVDDIQEAISDDEFLALFNEVSRLRDIFQGNHSFYRYSTRLMELMYLLRPESVRFEDESECYSSGDSLLFQFRLGTAVSRGEPLSAELALAWIKYHTEYSLRTPARRCAEEFSILFKRRYTKTFGDGIIVKPNKTRLKVNYYPSNSSLHGVKITPPDLPDPRVLRAPVQKLLKIADSCADSLDAYSRYLGKKEASRSDIFAIMLLPDEIMSENAERLFTDFTCWADERICDHSGLATVADFWKRMDTPAPDKINKKEAELMQQFAGRAGFGIAPDLRYHHARPASDGHIVLFSQRSEDLFIPSTEFQSVSLAIHLGVMVAQLDKHVDLSEQMILEDIIDHSVGLLPSEKRSLHAYLIWRLNSPASMTGLKGRIALLQGKDKAFVASIIVRVACADGKIIPAEIKQLEKIYSSLGLDSNTVISDIHHWSTTEKMAMGTSRTTSETSKTFSLDEQTLARHESDTVDVRQLLNTIFVEGDPADEPSAEISSFTRTGLDKAHDQLYQRLLEKERWTRHEVTELCQQYNLMLSGALETINDWSYAQVDAPVLDDDDDIYVDPEIVQELKG
ncbi:TerB N-terminal domain-containing protein [Enterobacter ludwigii]|uniref:tellurite resistance TerB family protein n=1 Tax=Enterobacter ludwigii TaxID=299767 RepID=UPI003F71CBFA